MAVGSPAHKLEAQLAASANVLELQAQFLHFPGNVMINFGEPDTGNSETYFVRSKGGLSLHELRESMEVYRAVVHSEIGAEEGIVRLNKLMRAPPVYTLRQRLFLAYVCAASICMLAFEGSCIDTLVAGACGMFLACLQIWGTSKSPLYANIFEITVAIIISLAARAFNSIPGHIFCYSAISSAGVVLILPGFLVLCASLELASKNILTGSVKMVHAIVYTLFLGFSLNIGSDLFFLIDPSIRAARAVMANKLTETIVLDGSFAPFNMSDPGVFGTFAFSHPVQDHVPVPEFHYQLAGCYREPNWPWYMQPAPPYMLLVLVPLFATALSLWNGQRWRSWHLLLMVFFGCCSFAANKAATTWVFTNSDIVTTIGAFVVGLLGNIYGNLFKKVPFPDMVTGVLLLVPAGLSVVGGLSNNDRLGDGSNSTMSGLGTGLSMLIVAIGITVGLFASTFLVNLVTHLWSKCRGRPDTKAVYSF